jgi:hypothetical protein
MDYRVHVATVELDLQVQWCQQAPNASVPRRKPARFAQQAAGRCRQVRGARDHQKTVSLRHGVRTIPTGRPNTTVSRVPLQGFDAARASTNFLYAASSRSASNSFVSVTRSLKNQPSPIGSALIFVGSSVSAALTPVTSPEMGA